MHFLSHYSSFIYQKQKSQFIGANIHRLTNCVNQFIPENDEIQEDTLEDTIPNDVIHNNNSNTAAVSPPQDNNNTGTLNKEK